MLNDVETNSRVDKDEGRPADDVVVVPHLIVLIVNNRMSYLVPCYRTVETFPLLWGTRTYQVSWKLSKIRILLNRILYLFKESKILRQLLI